MSERNQFVWLEKVKKLFLMLFLFFGFFYFLMLILFFAFSYSSFQVIYFVVHNMMHLLDSDLFSLSLLSCVLYFFFSFYASSN